MLDERESITLRVMSPKGRQETVPTSPLRLGISACLLGEPVRYDGGHRREAYLAEELGREVEWVAVCPEVGAGFGVPREILQVVLSSDGPRLVTEKTRRDRTEAFDRFTHTEIDRLDRLGICGLVVKARSPSCAAHGLTLHDHEGVPTGADGVGLFTRALRLRMPRLPVEDEEGMREPRRRQVFLDRARAYAEKRRGGSQP